MRSQAQDGQIASEQDMIIRNRLKQPAKDVCVAVGADIEIQTALNRRLEDVKGISNVFQSIGTTDMSNNQLDIRVTLCNLVDLL